MFKALLLLDDISLSCRHGYGVYLKLHTQDRREFLDPELLCCLLRCVATAAAVVHIGHKLLRRGKALQAPAECGCCGGAGTAAHGSFLRLNLYVETQIDNWIFCFCDITTTIARHTASKLAVKRSVKETTAAFFVVFPIPLRAGMQLVDEELVVLMRILLLITGQGLHESQLVAA